MHMKNRSDRKGNPVEAEPPLGELLGEFPDVRAGPMRAVGSIVVLLGGCTLAAGFPPGWEPRASAHRWEGYGGWREHSRADTPKRSGARLWCDHGSPGEAVSHTPGPSHDDQMGERRSHRLLLRVPL